MKEARNIEVREETPKNSAKKKTVKEIRHRGNSKTGIEKQTESTKCS